MIIPVINRLDFEGATRDIRLAEGFLSPASGWIHIDVSDGKFSDTKSWGNPEEFADLRIQLKSEIHLMVEGPLAVAEAWLKAGANRLIVPFQKVGEFGEITKLANKHKAEVMLSFDPNVSIGEVEKHIEEAEYIQLLAVHPGPSGQKFSEETLDKIEFLRGLSRGVKIEVDGGINPETGCRAMDAGADILVSGSYIFESDDPKAAFEELNTL